MRTTWLSSRPIDTGVVLRAVAICWVALNHAHPDAGFPFYPLPELFPTLHGGMTFLMMLSGVNFARFTLADAPDAAHVRRGLVLLGKGIFVPSFVAVLFFFLLHRQFAVLELLFVSNWVTVDRIAKFPVWYPQLMVQMFVGLYLLFSIPAFARGFLARPLVGAALLWSAGLVARLVLPGIVDTEPIRHHVPHLFLWNFVLGWVVYLLAGGRGASTAGRVVATACVCVSGLLAWGPDVLPCWWLIFGGAALIWVDRVRLPLFLANLARVVSEATFAIFLLHRFLFVIYEHTLWHAVPNLTVKWLFGVVGSFGAWLVWVSVLRAWRAVRQEAAVPVAPTVSR